MIFLRISKFYHAIYQRVSFVLLLLKVVSGISVSRFSFFHGDFSTCPSFPFMGWTSPKNALFQTCHAALPYRGAKGFIPLVNS